MSPHHTSGSACRCHCESRASCSSFLTNRRGRLIASLMRSPPRRERTITGAAAIFATASPSPFARSNTTNLSGEHAVMLQALPKPGLTGAMWHFAARPSSVPGAVDDSAAPDGSQALRLAYDFSNAMGTRAAYAQTELTLPGQPLAVAVNIFGDGNGEWLRGGYRNADGNDESVTIARHVDWRGWKTIRVAVPPQAAWPIVWTRLYVVERAVSAREQGSLWFRNFQIFFAGP